jgi:hypothetical protein
VRKLQVLIVIIVTREVSLLRDDPWRPAQAPGDVVSGVARSGANGQVLFFCFRSSVHQGVSPSLVPGEARGQGRELVLAREICSASLQKPNLLVRP